MTVYLLMITIAIAVVIIQTKKESKTITLILLLALFFISTFRGFNIGADYPVYIDAFKTYGTEWYLEKYGYFEYGYDCINYFAGMLSNNPVVLAAGVNLFLFIPLYLLVDNICESELEKVEVLFVFTANPYLYVQTTFNMMRQCCATGIVLIAILILLKLDSILKYLLFIITIVLAMQFHKTAAITLVILPLYFMRLNKKIWYAIAFISLLLWFVIAPETILFLSNLIGYNSSSYANYDASKLNHLIYVVLIFIYTLFMCSIYEVFSKTCKYRLLADLYMLSLCFLMFAVKNDMVYRIRIYFVFSSIIAFPAVIKTVSQIKFPEFLPLKTDISRKIIIAMHFGYYLCFFLGYFAYLAICKNTSYCPFVFAF